jgi:hypothetical protein
VEDTASGARPAEPLFEGLMESMTGIGGKRSGFGVAKDLDGFLGCVHNHPAILAFFEVLLNLLSKSGIKLFVEIVGEFDDNRFALHE